MKTSLEPQFLAAAILVNGFKPEPMSRAQASLLLLALKGQDVTGADIPEDITAGSKSLAGCATGALVAIGLLTVVGRVKSPKPDAKGRKVNVCRLAREKFASARAWLRANGVKVDEYQPEQLKLFA